MSSQVVINVEIFDLINKIQTTPMLCTKTVSPSTINCHLTTVEA